MKMKKWLAVLMTIAMCAVPVMGTIPADLSAPLSAYAEETTAPTDIPAWSGKSDHSWYDESESEFYLTTPEEFAGLMELGSKGFTMEGKTIYLETDVNLGGKELSVMENFAGTFEGNHHTIHQMTTTFVKLLNEKGVIQNLSIVFNSYGELSRYEDKGGIFTCQNNGTIQNCRALGTIKSIVMSPYTDLGMICGENCGTVSSCENKVTATLKYFQEGESSEYGYYYYFYYIGGICGDNSKGTISECTNSGTFYADGSQSNGVFRGGVCGSTQSKILNCENRGKITDKFKRAGGICGEITVSTAGTVENCTNWGDVTAECAGGIASHGRGRDYNVTISQCVNYGTITGDTYSGGITGISGTVFECENYGEVTGGDYAGGIAGSCHGVSNSANYGKITGTGNAGGIAGYVSTVSKCKNEGTVFGDCAGGILGNASVYNTISNLNSVYNTGEVSGSSYSGGICGSTGSGSIENSYNIGKVTTTKTSGKSGAVSADIKAGNCTNCYYSNISGAIGAGTMKSEKNMQTEEFAEVLGEDFIYIAGKFPILDWEAKETRFDKDTLYLTEASQQEKITLITLETGNVTWLSSDTNVVTVDNSGNVTAVGDGTAQIYAICGNKKAVCSVTVQQVQLEKSELSLEEGKTENISVVSTTTGKAITDMNFIYTSSDENIATVNESGLVTAVAEGSCEITVKSEYVNLTCQVTVSKETIVEIIPTLDKSTLTIEKGSTSPLHIKNYTGNVTWISSDTKIATVSGTGTSAVITALEEGKTIIYAMLDNGKNLTCQVTATKKTENTTFEPVLSLDVTSLILKKGTSSSIGISNFWMVANQDVTWVSSDTKVATVDGYSGVWWLANVTAIGEGTATIYAMLSSGENLTCQVTVTEDGTILMGDVDGDGSVKVADLVLLQKWIHADPNAKLANWQTADFNGDGKVNVIDLALMKQTLIKNK